MLSYEQLFGQISDLPGEVDRRMSKVIITRHCHIL